LYEKVENLRRQLSQFTTWYYLFSPAQSAEFKFTLINIYKNKKTLKW